jgi:hypothetical protein
MAKKIQSLEERKCIRADIDTKWWKGKQRKEKRERERKRRFKDREEAKRESLCERGMDIEREGVLEKIEKQRERKREREREREGKEKKKEK